VRGRRYKLLDRKVMAHDPQSLKAVLLKTAADQAVWAPVMTLVYFVFLRCVEGHPELIPSTIQVRRRRPRQPARVSSTPW